MYDRIFSQQLDGEYLVQLAKLYLFVNSNRENQLVAVRSHDDFGGREEFVAYTQWYIMYCISLLSGAKGRIVPSENEFDALTKQAQEIIAKIADKYRHQSFYRVFRSAKTKEIIMNELGVGQLNFEF